MAKGRKVKGRHFYEVGEAAQKKLYQEFLKSAKTYDPTSETEIVGPLIDTAEPAEAKGYGSISDVGQPAVTSGWRKFLNSLDWITKVLVIGGIILGTIITVCFWVFNLEEERKDFRIAINVIKEKITLISNRLSKGEKDIKELLEQEKARTLIQPEKKPDEKLREEGGHIKK